MTVWTLPWTADKMQAAVTVVEGMQRKLPLHLTEQLLASLLRPTEKKSGRMPRKQPNQLHQLLTVKQVQAQQVPTSRNAATVKKLRWQLLWQLPAKTALQGLARTAVRRL